MKELLFTDLTPRKDFISDWLTQNTTDLTLTLVDTDMFDRTGERRD